MKDIYFDNSATTPPCPAALQRYCEVAAQCYGNPSSLHATGLAAAHILDEARAALRRSLAVRDGQVIFTAGGSESNNLAILGRAHAKARYRGGRLITTAGEHASVALPLAHLREEGYEVVEIGTRRGVLDLDELQEALTPKTVLVSMMLVNNETGAQYDLPAAARLVHALAPEAAFHVDATQAYLKLPLQPQRDGYDMVTVSSHKVEGPKGCGALWVSAPLLRQKGLSPLILGGGQEGGLRAGTENVPAIAAFATAVQEGHAALATRAAHMAHLRLYLLEQLQQDPELAPLRPNLPPVAAPHIVSLTAPCIKSETLLHFLSSEGICVSSGSACSSHGRHSLSPLTAFGLTDREIDCTIRISFSYRNTAEEVDQLCAALKKALRTLVRMH